MQPLLKLMAIILVMTAALNAQCVATCATQQPEHACCPHHKSVHADTVQAPALPVALPFEIAPQQIPTQLTSFNDLISTAILPRPDRQPLTTALRL
jgi:hypothetical protein